MTLKYVTEYRNPEKARAIARTIAAEADPARNYRFMEFCGGHTHILARWGLTELLPLNLRMIHGPGCPVCVLPVGRLDLAFDLLEYRNVTLCTYADLMRVPATGGRTLFKAKAAGADVRMVYSPTDALTIARANPDRDVVFFAIGFETTTPPTAAAVKIAAKENLTNFSVVCSHVLTPAAMEHILLGNVPLDGIVGPAHVSTVIGEAPYRRFAQKYRIPVVICGFEPLDMLLSILMLVRQVNDGRAEVENEFTRGVAPDGNPVALRLMKDVFVRRPAFAWRGLGIIPESALALAPTYARFDAEKKFHLTEHTVAENQACECGAILRGEKEPKDCRVFGTVCTPLHPIGACMVSSEGACAAFYAYEQRRLS